MCTHSNVECGFLPATNESDHSGLVFYKDTSYEVNVTDPIFVRIYVHAIRTDSCTGGLTDSQIIAAIEILRKDFKNAGIYFLWDCEVDCLPDDDEYSNAGGNAEVYNYHSHLDGVDIYLYPEFSLSTNQGHNSTQCILDGSAFYIAGNFHNDCVDNPLILTPALRSKLTPRPNPHFSYLFDA